MSDFKRWYVNVLATIAGLVIAQYFGFFQMVWEADVTKISVVIFGLWAIATIMIGRSQYDYRGFTIPEFIGERLCPGLGMIGTIIGFIVMVHGVELHDANDTETLKQAIGSMLSGFGVAMYTTLVGTIASLSIASQMVEDE